MIQLMQLIGFQHLRDISCHPANYLKIQMIRIGEKIGAQCATNQYGDPLIAQNSEALERVRHIGQKFLFARSGVQSIFWKEKNPGTPVESWCHPRSENGNGEHQ